LKSSIHRSIWEQAFIPVDSSERSVVKVFVDGIGARIAEGLGATLIFVWLMRIEATDAFTLDTAWIAWILLPTAAVWLWLTRNLRMDLARESTAAPAVASNQQGAIECERFPDQCPCTTEWGKGIK
jgi:ATP/ADP translocase